MKYLTSLLIIGFISVAVFGVFAMNHGGEHRGCLAAMTKNAACPEESAASFLDFHLGVFRSFSTAVFDSAFLAALIAALPLFAVLALWPDLYFVFRVPHLAPMALAGFLTTQQQPSFKETITRWLALHETSPTVF